MSLFNGKNIDYDSFAQAVGDLMHEGYLIEMKSSGRNSRTPSLALRFRMGHGLLKMEFQAQLQKLQLEMHPLISLDQYYKLGENVWKQDAAAVHRINEYLKRYGLPDLVVSASERSYALVQDEKWIMEQGGKATLIRLGLWDHLLIRAEYDPLMMAVNPYMMINTSAVEEIPCLHLIVENKTTFQALLPVMTESCFHTLIYGCGNKISGNIDMFDKQFPLQGGQHQFYYFGDIDHTGIQIWHSVSHKRDIKPALPFYQACLQKKYTTGKQNQRVNYDALIAFQSHFSQKEQQQLQNCLQSSGYYPQESLSAFELQKIWRDTNWIKEWNT
ncbi:Wadjet anti-phage system protein JetD domain-containing protein [Paenibacillus xylanexedens]|uniref:Wadjet anti-phage system protein JetD domain-containing protein n=1 Tax=Paenibacillus xylanexedens TaxID=528191 RepID=UPI001643DBD6|nr:Wadjet anti-phage system protein JetD domain-containing protein [Paenibacillus xylanexedens]